MTLLTAATPNQIPLTELQHEAALLCGIKKEQHLIVPIDPKYPRPYSWFKLRALIHHLPHHKGILWIDADAMPLEPLPNLEKHCPEMVALSRDINGWNCGVMFWRNCPEAFEWLWTLYDSFDQYRDHPWYEQAAFHTKAEAMMKHGGIRILAKTWNSYEGEDDGPPLILHLPARSDEYRLKVMGYRLKKLQEQS